MFGIGWNDKWKARLARGTYYTDNTVAWLCSATEAAEHTLGLGRRVISLSSFAAKHDIHIIFEHRQLKVNKSILETNTKSLV